MTVTTLEREQVKTANPPPIPGPLGTHPVGTGLGAAAGGAAAGALAGTVAGPVGTVVGAVAGAVAGGLAGKKIARQSTPPPRKLTGARIMRVGPMSPAGRPSTSIVPPIATASMPMRGVKAARSNRRSPS